MRTNIKSFEEKDNEDKELLISVLREQLKVCDDKIETLLEEDSCVFPEKELEEELTYLKALNSKYSIDSLNLSIPIECISKLNILLVTS